ncbi:hypothetical protein D3C72_1482260 [compost metagenome]
MTLIEALTGPHGGTWQPFNQVFTLHVGFTEGWVSGFPVVLLCNGVRDVGVEVEALIAFFPHFLAQFQLSVSFTFVTKTIFTLCTRCLEALLRAAATGPADTRTGVTFKIDGARVSRQNACSHGDCQWKFAQSNHYSIS